MDDDDLNFFMFALLIALVIGGFFYFPWAEKKRLGAIHHGFVRITEIGGFTANHGYSYEVLIGQDIKTGEVLVSKTEDKRDVLFLKEGMVIPYVNYEHDKAMRLTAGDM